MTTERWTDEMLDRLVHTVNSIATLAEQNILESRELRTSIERLHSVAEIHQQTLETHQQNLQVHQQNFEVHQQNFDAHQQSFNVVMEEIREIQSEVRGLQTENRRILDQLINRDNDDDNND